MGDDSVLYSDLETFKEHFSQAIREENIAEQIDMTMRLGILAEHLGEKITRTELLPFLHENLDFHDEILLHLSEQLKKFIPLVGGYEHSQPVLDILKKICNTDETIVREKTIETLKYIAEDLNCEQTEHLLLPLLEALSNEDWFTSKSSAVALFPIVYPKVKEERRVELRHNFRILAQDNSPIVRKAAAITLLDLIPLLDKESLKNEFISVFDNISNDNMDSVQVNAIKVAITLCKRLLESEIEEFIFKTLENFSESSSWKTRQALALNIAEIQEAIPFPKCRGKILAMFQKLLKNSEEEVRIVAVKNLVAYCRSLKESYEKFSSNENNFEPVFVQSIVPQIALLVVDSSVDVKLALAKNILSLSTVITKQTFMEHIMPMVVDILELDASVPVKANILENLNDLPRDVDFAQSLPSIKQVVRTLIVYSQSHWRTRKGLLVAFMHIAKFANQEYFSNNLKIYYASLLGDPVFAVRRTAPIILPLLAKQYGMKWTSEQIIPYFKMFTKDNRYLYRYVPLFGINELINPSVISGEETRYLGGLKETKVPGVDKFLFRLKCMLNKLQRTLEEKTFEDILSLNKSIDDFKTDNVYLYAGETLTSLKTHYGENILSCEAENIEKPNDCYLIGLVSLICREFLGLLLTLFDDTIVNVQIRSIYTLNKIKIFAENLRNEISESWVEDCIKVMSKEEMDAIQKEVDEQLCEKSMEIDEEKIDTELMENIFISSSLPNATEHISEENTTNTEVTTDTKTDVDISFIDDLKIEADTKIENKLDFDLKLSNVSEIEKETESKNTPDEENTDPRPVDTSIENQEVQEEQNATIEK